jgi:hypothetical protein
MKINWYLIRQICTCPILRYFCYYDVDLLIVITLSARFARVYYF